MPTSKIDPYLLKKLLIERKKVWEIAKIMNVSECTIIYWKKKLGFPSRRENARKRRELFKKLYFEGKTYKEISKILGVGIPTLMLYRIKLNLPPRQKWLSPEERLQRERQKLEFRVKLLNLVQERGVVNVDEAAELLNTDRKLINKLIADDDQLEKVSLCFARSPASKLIPTMVFGNYTGKHFVFCASSLEPVKQFLIKVIKQNLKRPLTRGEVVALRYRLEKRMRFPEEMVDDVICSLTFEFYE